MLTSDPSAPSTAPTSRRPSRFISTAPNRSAGPSLGGVKKKSKMRKQSGTEVKGGTINQNEVKLLAIDCPKASIVAKQEQVINRQNRGKVRLAERLANAEQEEEELKLKAQLMKDRIDGIKALMSREVISDFVLDALLGDELQEGVDSLTSFSSVL